MVTQALIRRGRQLDVGNGRRTAAAAAYNDRGCALLERREVRAACAQFREALRLDPSLPGARMNLAIALLTLGEFAEGWEYFDYAHPSAPPPHAGRRWVGSDPSGKTILLYGEGGLGNVIQFARYATPVAQRGARVVLECQPQLKHLLASVPGVAQVIAHGEAPPAFHAYAPLASLPRIFGTTLDNIRASIPYVAADPALAKHWGRELRRLAGFPVRQAHGRKVGIVWQAEQRTAYGRQRSIPLEYFAPLSRVPGVRLICLQKDWTGRAPFPMTILADLDGSCGPFMDTAAVMKHLDLVITADTSTAHLAGALGVQVWVAQRYAPDWRWMLDRDDSPWYPTLRLFRQKRPGDWAGVFAQIVERLRAGEK